MRHSEGFFQAEPTKIDMDISRHKTHHVCEDGPGDDLRMSLGFKSQILPVIGQNCSKCMVSSNTEVRFIKFGLLLHQDKRWIELED